MDNAAAEDGTETSLVSKNISNSYYVLFNIDMIIEHESTKELYVSLSTKCFTQKIDLDYLGVKVTQG